MDDALQERVEALERTVADGEFDGSDTNVPDERLSTLESRLDAVESTLEEVEAATQALRGYVGNVRAVNDEIEQRADAAIAKVRALEDELGESAKSTSRDSTPRPADGDQRATQTAQSDTGHRDTAPEPTTGQRCQSCGRVHADEQAETDGGGSRQSRGQTSGDALVPEGTDETGRLRRIRELL